MAKLYAKVIDVCINCPRHWCKLDDGLFRLDSTHGCWELNRELKVRDPKKEIDPECPLPDAPNTDEVMQWISEDHEYRGQSYKIEGWHLNSQKSYEVPIHCKRCKTQTPIKNCSRRGVKGYAGDSVAAPIFELLCPECGAWLGTLDESDPRLATGPNPLLSLQEKNAELINEST